MATNNAISLGQFTKGITNMKNYTDEKTRGLHFEEEVFRIPAETIQEAYDNRTNENNIKIPIGLDDSPDADALMWDGDSSETDTSLSNVNYYISFMGEEYIGYSCTSMVAEEVCTIDNNIQIYHFDPDYEKYTSIKITDNFKTKEITDLVLTIVKDIDFYDAFDISSEGIVLNKGKTYISYENADYSDIINRSCLEHVKYELEGYSSFNSTIASLQAQNLYISPQRKRRGVRLENFYIIPADYSDINNKNKCKIATTLYGFIDDRIPIKMNDVINFVLNYRKINTTFSSKVINTTGLIYSKTITIEEGIDDYEILLEIFADKWAKYNDDKTDIIIEDYNYYTTVIQMTFKDDISINKINDIIEESKIYIELCRLNTLTLDNEEEYTPITDYNPSTKKYVDSKTSLENVIFEGLYNDELVISDAYTGLKDGFAYVIDKEIELSNNSDLFDYYITIGSSETENLFTFTPDMFKYQDSSQSYMASVDNTQFNGSIDICNKYNDQTNKIVITYDYITDCSTGSIGFKYMKIFTSNELINIVNNKLDKTSLNGGTTGQILSKKSNTDNDVEWINPQIKIINPTSTEEFFNLTKDGGLYYISDNIRLEIEDESDPDIVYYYYLYGINNVSVYEDGYRYYINYENNFSFTYGNEGITSFYSLTDTVHYLQSKLPANKIATETYVNNKVAGLVNSAPETLDTLNELATALGNDANFATTVATNIGNKVDKVDGMGLSKNDLSDELKANYDAAYAYSKATHSYNDLTDKPEIPSIDGLATEEYINNRTLNYYKGTKDEPILLTDIKFGWSIIDGYYKWYPEYNNNPIICVKKLMYKAPLGGSNFTITYMNGSNPTVYYVIDNNVEPGDYYVLNTQVLMRNNTEEYTPTDDYNPSTKKYVDDNIKTIQSQLGVPVSYSRPENSRVWIVPTFPTSTEFQYIDEWVQNKKFVKNNTEDLWVLYDNTGTSVNENKMYLETVKELKVTNNTDSNIAVYLHFIKLNTNSLGYATIDIEAHTTSTIYCNTSGVCDYASGKLYVNKLINPGDIEVVPVY